MNSTAIDGSVYNIDKYLLGRVKLIRAMIKAIDQTMIAEKMVGAPNIYPLKEEWKAVFATIINNIRKDDLGHFLSRSLEDDEAVSYADKPKYRYDANRRKISTLPRYIVRNFIDIIKKTDIKDHVIQQWCATAISIMVFESVNDQIEICRGQKVLEMYDELNSHIHSCMTGSNSVCTKLYAANPSKVGMVVRKTSAGRYISRAMLWNTDQGAVVLDRIYPDDQGTHVSVLKQWAAAKGYVTRSNNSFPDCNHIKLSDGNVYTVTLKPTKEKDYFGSSRERYIFPYLDTFTYGQIADRGKKLVLSNDINNQSVRVKYAFVSAEGSYYFVKTCRHCGKGRMYSDNGITVYYRGRQIMCCSVCASEKLTFVCSACGQRHFKSDLAYTGSDEYVLCKSCARQTKICSSCGKITTDYRYIVNGKKQEVLCDECFGEDFAEGTVKLCQWCNRYYAVSEINKLVCEDEGLSVYPFVCDRCVDGHFGEEFNLQVV